jgi:peptidoglycan hydrolase-like protein with peptidoglycan-binding domain
MPDIKDSVGESGTNNTHDVAIVQVMLRVIKDAKGVAYLGSNYDGKYGPSTKDAIIRFQQDQKLVALPVQPAAAPKVAPGAPPAVGTPAPGAVSQSAGSN